MFFIIVINNLINKIWEFREFQAYNEVESGRLRQTPQTPVVTRCDKLECKVLSSLNNDLCHKTCFSVCVAAIYSASAVDKARHTMK